MVTVAVRTPVPWGVNVMVKALVSPGATEVDGAVVTVKSAALGPVMATGVVDLIGARHRPDGGVGGGGHGTKIGKVRGGGGGVARSDIMAVAGHADAHGGVGDAHGGHGINQGRIGGNAVMGGRAISQV